MTQATMRYEVHAQNTGAGVSEASCKETRITFDSGPALSPQLAGPAELLAAAFAACVLKNVSRFAEILPFRYEHASIDVAAEREDAPPRIARVRYVLRLVTEEPPHRLENLGKNIEKFGTIYNTLAAVCDVSGEIVAEPPSGAPHKPPQP
ncbi:MAG: OsmC family protein [Dehalococcoidia bacterium]